MHEIAKNEIILKHNTDSLRAIKIKEKAINTRLIAASKLPKPQLAIEYIPQPTIPAQRRTNNFDLSVD